MPHDVKYKLLKSVIKRNITLIFFDTQPLTLRTFWLILAISLFFVYLFVFLRQGVTYLVQAGLEYMILLPQSTKC
jgi:hypothetical protein